MSSPSNAASLKRRQFLSGLMKLLLFIGFILISIPFISSLSSGDNERNEQVASRWIASVPVTDLSEGKVTVLSWSGGVVWVYSRSKKDIQTLIELSDEKLADTFSKKSDQPNKMQNPFRSFDQKYFVFIPRENVRGCQVSLNDERNVDVVFVEPCYRAAFDAAGRIFKTSGNNKQQNLPVPKHIVEDGVLKVAVWTAKVN